VSDRTTLTRDEIAGMLADAIRAPIHLEPGESAPVLPTVVARCVRCGATKLLGHRVPPYWWCGCEPSEIEDCGVVLRVLDTEPIGDAREMCHFIGRRAWTDKDQQFRQKQRHREGMGDDAWGLRVGRRVEKHRWPLGQEEVVVVGEDLPPELPGFKPGRVT